MTRPRTVWLAGLTVGVGAGALSLVIPIVGWTIGAAFLVGALLGGAVAAAAGGLLIGGGTAWIALLVGADGRCRAFVGPGSACVPPEISPWLAIGVALVVGGTVATVAAIRGDRLRSRRPTAGGRS